MDKVKKTASYQTLYLEGFMKNNTSQERRKALKTVGAMGAGLLAASTLTILHLPKA